MNKIHQIQSVLTLVTSLHIRQDKYLQINLIKFKTHMSKVTTRIITSMITILHCQKNIWIWARISQEYLKSKDLIWWNFHNQAQHLLEDQFLVSTLWHLVTPETFSTANQEWMPMMINWTELFAKWIELRKQDKKGTLIWSQMIRYHLLHNLSIYLKIEFKKEFNSKVSLELKILCL